MMDSNWDSRRREGRDTWGGRINKDEGEKGNARGLTSECGMNEDETSSVIWSEMKEAAG